MTIELRLEKLLLVIHGEYDVEVSKGTIKVTVSGAFNDLGAKALTTELKAAIVALNQTPFVMLGDLLYFNGGTPEVFAESDNFNAWLNSQNMIAKALIFTSPIHIAIEKSLVKSKAKQNIQYFENEHTALKWLDAQVDEFNAKLA